MKRIINIFMALVFIFSFFTNSVDAWTGNNTYDQYTYQSGQDTYLRGKVQIQPSHNDGGYHYARGTIAWSGHTNGSVHTSYGSSASDNHIYSKSKTLLIYDHVRGESYNYSFTFTAEKVRHGAPGSAWPA